MRINLGEKRKKGKKRKKEKKNPPCLVGQSRWIMKC
jgi:hypothetical protein